LFECGVLFLEFSVYGIFVEGWWSVEERGVGLDGRGTRQLVSRISGGGDFGGGDGGLGGLGGGRKWKFGV
jgi:hypothetical protein